MILDVQQRLAEVGRVRIGQQVPTQGGRKRPAKLDRFRLTSPDRRRIDAAAELWGGEVQPWESPAGQQWEVVTDTTELPVIVPPEAMAFSQWYELWSAGGCQRRCDGQTETLREQPCVCDPDARECTPHSRLSVMLRDLQGLGLWRLDTQGWYAANELAGSVQVLAAAAGRGALLPARLRLEQRTVKRPGADGKPQTRHFAVPVLDVEITPHDLLGGVAGLTAAPSPDAIVEGPRAELTAAPMRPVPGDARYGAPVPGVAEQVAAVDAPRAGKRRSNAAAAIPDPGLPGEDDEPAVEGPRVSEPQRKKLMATCGDAGLSDAQRHVLVSVVTDGRTESTSQLTRGVEFDAALVMAEAAAVGLVAVDVDAGQIVSARRGEPVRPPIDVEAARRQVDAARGRGGRDAEVPTDG